jgi:hypothetical protein
VKRTPPGWDAGFARRHRALQDLHGELPRFESGDWPGIEALDALLSFGRDRPHTLTGLPVHAVPCLALGGAGFELHVAATGAVPVRGRCWHDLFNLLSWRAFPCTKAAVNAAHLVALAEESADRRGPRRNALAGFDGDGLIVACEDESLAALVRGFRWRELFVDHRDAAREGLHAFAFGHALCEKLLAPFKGITGKAAFVAVAPGFGTLTRGEQLSRVDALAAPLVGGLDHPRALAPLPVLGLPGWCADNEDPAFYDDATVFRPGRRARNEPHGDPGPSFSQA